MFCGVYRSMPDYEYEALDSSGKSVTGTSSHPNEAFARAKLEKLGLHPVKLTVITSSIPEDKRTAKNSPLQFYVGLVLFALAVGACAVWGLSLIHI